MTFDPNTLPSPRDDHRPLANRRVLVVEDDDAIRSLLDLVLAAEGYDVRTAEHGGAALDVLERWSPHLILLDLMMPVLDGWGFRARQVANPSWAAIPVILLSAVYEVSRQAEVLAVAAVHAKPFDLDDLLATVGGLVNTR
ncbi:MAG: response regulator [Chloroflexota bacterium]|nr:response regulator [Chloroflexota bacterium]